MSFGEGLAVKISNYKCIGDEPQGFDTLQAVNLIIGRNNAGKSTLLDLIERVVTKDYKFQDQLWHKKKEPRIIYSTPLTETAIRRVFSENTSQGGVPGRNHWEYGRAFVGKKITKMLPNNEFVELESCPEALLPIDDIQNAEQYKTELARNEANILEGKSFKRLHAERNILPEIHSNEIQVDGHGNGATNIIQNFINNANLPSELVERDLLQAINKICGKDAQFTRILCQQYPDNKWEIFLEQQDKGRIALSHTGSGFKTIILALIFVHLVSFSNKKPLKDFTFAFEELENNLHPSLLRNLLRYLREIALKSECLVFITTHSNVAIDLFSQDKNAQIIHVTHNGVTAEAKAVKTYIENKGILDDLDVRASDLLQSNCVIWVEGPSDRLYVNKWLNLWSDGEFVEGTHYQCIFYGGRLLAHLTLDDPSQRVQDWINLLSANRNAIILMDSDKKGNATPINATKRRIIEETLKMGGVAWVTKGREVENYVPGEAVCKLLEIKSCRQVDQFEYFFQYLNGIKSKQGEYYATRKPLLAERLCQFYTKENLMAVLDLPEKLSEVYQKVKQWNSY